MEVIDFNTNPFGGVVINHHALPEDPEQFRRQLHHSLEAWREDLHKVAWLEIPTPKAALVPVAVEAGFVYHHASEAYLMLTKQIMQGAYVPPYASHYIGAGGVVLSEERELLVVSERHRRSRGPAYKLPGGALMPGEHLTDGVIREVLEETGVKTKFEALVCFRHWHGYRYDKSDIYFVSRLSPLSKEITIQEEELDEVLWMPVDDFLNDDGISIFNKTIVKAALKSPGIVPSFIPGYGDERQYEFFLPREVV
ncbi:MAG: NUDIX domain-containing protein [Chloroflexi bacterium]|nr:NUDIX domain-containing protein [Chloroflexota bacterium]MCI0870157.1 NUDIX domain-containing protein [Chloroflexota bacterium]